MITKILISLGLRSQCCGGKIETWHAGKDICASCHKWLRKDVSLEAIKSLDKPKARQQFRLKRIK